jgi:hypothetical protein
MRTKKKSEHRTFVVVMTSLLSQPFVLPLEKRQKGNSLPPHTKRDGASVTSEHLVRRLVAIYYISSPHPYSR